MKDQINSELRKYEDTFYLNVYKNNNITLDSALSVSLGESLSLLETNSSIKKGILNKIENCNDNVIELKKARRLIEDSLDAADDFQWAKKVIESTSDYVFTTKDENTFSYKYIKSIERKKDRRHFFFLNNYSKKSSGIPSENENLITYEDSSINFLDKNHLNTFFLTSNFLSEEKLSERKYDYLSSTTFITQNLINLAYNYYYLYPNTAVTSIVSESLNRSKISCYNMFFDDSMSEASDLYGKSISNSYINNRINRSVLGNTRYYNASETLSSVVLLDCLDNSIELNLQKNAFSNISSKKSNILSYYNNYKNIFSNELYSTTERLNINFLDFGSLNKVNENVEQIDSLELAFVLLNYNREILKNRKQRGLYDDRENFYYLSEDLETFPDKQFEYYSEEDPGLLYQDLNNESSFEIFRDSKIDSLYVDINSLNPVLDKFYWKNSQSIFKDISLLFSTVRDSPVDKFIYEKNYDIKSRYIYYFEEYKNIFNEKHRGSSLSNVLDNDELDFQFLSLRSSSESTDFLKSYFTKDNSDIKVKESVSEKDAKIIDKIKLNSNFVTNKYKNYINKDNEVHKIILNFGEAYIDKLKVSDSEYIFTNAVGFENGIINKDTLDLDIIAKREEDSIYLSNENKESLIPNVKSTNARISKEIGLSIPSKDSIDSFKKNTLANNFLKNSKEINNRAAKDISSLFKKFGEKFQEDYQVSAFDKLIASYYASGKFDDTSYIKDLTSLLIATSIMTKTNNSEVNYMSGKDNKSDVVELDSILSFKEISASIFSQKNISMQDNYFFESNTRSHFHNINTTRRDFYLENLRRMRTRGLIQQELGDNSFDNFDILREGFYFEDYIGYRSTNSLAMCFPYNTLNLFSTIKNLDNKNSIFDYYDYGVNYLGHSYKNTRNAISGSYEYNDNERLVITFPTKVDGNVQNSLNDFFIPKPIAFRKINTIDSYKNVISTIDHLEESKENCETVVMHYIWDKKIDYKDIKLMSGQKISNIEEFLRVFSKRDTIQEFTNDYSNLIDTSSYPLHEMFYINRKLQNRLFSNINDTSLLGLLSNTLSEIVKILKIDTRDLSNLKEAYDLVSSNKELNEIVEGVIKVYSCYYETYYKRFFERYFATLQEIHYVKQNIYDTYSYRTSKENIGFKFFGSFNAEIPGNDFPMYYSAKSSLVKNEDNKGYTVKSRGNSSNVIRLNDYLNKGEMFYTSVCNGYHDTVLSISMKDDEEYMFQEYYSLFMYPENMVSPYSSNKLSLYEQAEKDIFVALKIVDASFDNTTDKIIAYCNDNNTVEIDANEEYGLINFYKDANNTLVRNDISYAFSIDILLNYLEFLSEEEARKTNEFRKISEDLEVLSSTKSMIDVEEDSLDFVTSITNKKYYNKMIQNINYSEKNILSIIKAFKDKSNTINTDNQLRNLEISKFDIEKLDRKVNFCRQFISENLKSKNSSIDMLFLNVESFIYDNILVKFTIEVEGTNFSKEYYYKNNILHFEFEDSREVYGNICFVDQNEYNLDKKLKYIEKEELVNYLTYKENIDMEQLSTKLYQTINGSNFCKAYIEVNSINSLISRDEFGHVSLNTVGLIEELGEENVNIVFGLNSQPQFDSQISEDVYENVDTNYNADNMSVIKEYCSVISKYNSNYLLEKSLSYKNIDKYLIIPILRENKAISVYKIKAEIIL
jgi:hypothetical protein